jgi:pectate lyase
MAKGGGGSGGTTGGTATGGSSTGGSVGKGGSTSTSACIGWASVNAEGVARTTGGEGGPVVQITTAEQLASYRRDTDPKILRIMNDLTGEFELGSNKTVEGATNNITIHGSLSFSGTTTMTLSNLIVRNLKIDAVTSGEDGMDVRFAHHVCVEHCEFVNGPDGNLDVVSEANYVTIAYNKFYYTSAWHPLPGETAANHRFSNLVGSSNTTELDRGKLKVTFHHNWWADGVVERMPRVRFGDVHVFNNYYSSTGNDYCVAGGKEARLVVENNYFENVSNPHEFYDGDTTAQIKASGNEYVNVTGLKDSGQGASFTPPYPYTLEPGAAVKASVMANVGPR